MNDDGSAPIGTSDRTAGVAIDSLEVYLTGDTVRDLLGAVDADALIEGQPVAEAIDRELAGEVLGQLLGQALAEELAGDGRVSEVGARLLGRRAGGQVGRLAVLALLEYGLLDASLDRLRERTDDDGVHRLLDGIEAATLGDSNDAAEDLSSGSERNSGDPSSDTDDLGAAGNGRRPDE